MKPWALLRLLFLWPAFAGSCAPALLATTPVPGDPLRGNGNVNRCVLAYSELFSFSRSVTLNHSTLRIMGLLDDVSELERCAVGYAQVAAHVLQINGMVP